MYPATGANMTINFVRIEPGADVPLHEHPHEQGGTVIEGSIFMTIEGETREMRAGDVYIAPPNSVHGATAGPEGCLVVDVFSPPRDDYRDAAKLR
jgi:quercetin dioxygenase-like cupin family protein